jgi:hypothetical protein
MSLPLYVHCADMRICNLLLRAGGDGRDGVADS